MTAEPLRPPDPPQAFPDWRRYLAVDADLAIEVDNAAGEHATGRLTSNGHRLRLEFDRPEILTGTADRSTVGVVTAQLARAQLHAELHGPSGRIARVDPDRTSRVSGLLTGSPYLVLDRPGWVLAARTAAPATAAVTAVAAAVIVSAVALVRRRRS